MGWFPMKRAPTLRADPTAYVAGANGFGAAYHPVFSWHPLPEAGAMQYSWDTLCLPKYSPIGNGPGNRREFQTLASSMQPLHGVVLTAIGSPGVLTGQFIAQPLQNTTSGPDALTGQVQQNVANLYQGITLNAGQYQLPA